MVAGGGAGEGEEVMDNGLPEELVKLLQDSPGDFKLLRKGKARTI